ncbi:hypothetical protein [Devosia beringensis]|uniref:hypothetical protein n=1 Tax=Devosia beringensis TaxID=2657486 RepID=UPI00186B89F4|nr:hypothetical protein [Devosia beringensis]
MRKTPAEYQREYRERKKAARKAAPDLAMEFIRTPFSETTPSDSDDPFEFVEYFVPFGLQFPEGFFDENAQYDVDDLVGTDVSLSSESLLERMEGLAGVFLTAADELYRKINDFKLAEIDARIAEVEQSELSDPAAKAKALRDIVTLQDIRSQLSGKTFRRSFAEINVKGSASD